MMKQTWRWFGPADTISMDELLQVGVEGVVSALHHIGTGDVWSVEEIKKRQDQISKKEDGSPSHLTWDVVESVPVSEDIKTQTGNWLEHIENYKQSLRNLASCGIEVVCYNFMPVLDWTRTELRSKLPHGGNAMRFDLLEFACFDIHILARKDAHLDYPSDVQTSAHELFKTMTKEDCLALQHNIVAGLPGSNDKWGLEDIKRLLNTYQNIDADQLRSNLVAFLEHMMPTCQELNIRLCCHPDDPPFSILGLPRIMSTANDYAYIMRAVDNPYNGITICTGSLGVRKDINFEEFITQWGGRIHFAHLRNTARDGVEFDDKHSFYEAEHLEGDTDMVQVIKALLAEQNKRKNAGRDDWQIPMRPDHGQELLSDLDKDSMPGYPLIGRMRGLAELRGIMKALN
jgi:mannonate dehydratase